MVSARADQVRRIMALVVDFMAVLLSLSLSRASCHGLISMSVEVV